MEVQKPRSYEHSRCVQCDIIFNDQLDYFNHKNKVHPPNSYKKPERKDPVIQSVFNFTPQGQSQVVQLVQQTVPQAVPQVSPQMVRVVPRVPKAVPRVVKVHTSPSTSTSTLEELSFKCPICSVGFQAESSLKSHMATVHKSVDIDKQIGLPYSCEFCEEEFNVQSCFKMHVRLMHKESKNLSCDDCGKPFTKRSDLVRHFLSMHEHRRYKCALCDFTSSQTDRRNNHQLAVHNIDMRTSANKKQKKTHIEQQGTTITTVVHVEPQGPNTVVTVEQQQQQHEEGTGRCEECELDFESKAKLRKHLKRVHNIEDENVDFSAKFECSRCGGQFNSETLFIKHIEEHQKKAENEGDNILENSEILGL